MSYFQTAADLKADALLLAGEPPSGSEYDDLVYEWLTTVERVLVAGGPFGPSLLEPLDWPWARAYPRGVIQLTQPVNADAGADAIFSAGSSNVIVDTTNFAGAVDFTYMRLFRNDVAARHLVVSQEPSGPNAVLLTLQSPWTGPSDTVSDWLAYPDTYALPTDFLRGCSPLYLAGVDLTWGPGLLDVIDPTRLEAEYPSRSLAWGVPCAAARVSDTRLRFSHYLDPAIEQNVQVEFEYIRDPPVLAAGSLPLVPSIFRRVLSYGAAFLILEDKGDSVAQPMFQRFEMGWKAMRDATVRNDMRMSRRWGVVQPARLSGYGLGPWGFTESGIPIWSW